MAKSLKIEHVDLTNVGGFESISVSFNAGFNLICGPNGVGKTTLLDVIGSIFVANYDTKTVRRRADTEVGLAKFSATVDGVRREGSGRIDGFEPNTSTHPFGFNDTSNQIIYVKSNRDFSYVNLQGVMRDPEKGEHNFQQDALNGISIDDVKQWFSNRYLMEPHGDHWPEYQRDNLRLAKSFFSMLDEEVSLSHVNSSTFDIMLSTRSGTIPFEYMSAGFRAAYSMIFGILKEVEFRGLGITASEFSGIILIDELDLHLHPTWHRVMMEGLQEAYPSAQIIVTTHSPHMIQAAKLESVIVLSAPPKVVVDRPAIDPEYGFIGWTVEEILRDIMGLEDSRPPEFVMMLADFERAVSHKDDGEIIGAARKRLERALHPSSILRQIIDIEAI